MGHPFAVILLQGFLGSSFCSDTYLGLCFAKGCTSLTTETIHYRFLKTDGKISFSGIYRGFLETLKFMDPSSLNLMTSKWLFSLFNEDTYIWEDLA